MGEPIFRFLLYLKELDSSNDFCNEFQCCKTNNDRFKLALESVSSIAAACCDVKTEQKSCEHSARLRDQGNRVFLSGQYFNAIAKYTESIAYAVDLSVELALAYGNRSAALHWLGKHADAIIDIDRALCLKYPDKLKAKLYKRKGSCFERLGLPGAKSLFQEALVWLDKMKSTKTEIREIKSELKNYISAPCTIAKPAQNVFHCPLTEIPSPNPEIPCASDAITMKYSEKFGRHFVATRKIKPGEILIAEKPYCAWLDSENTYTHCSYCLKVSWAMIPCKHCIYVAYCSEICRGEAWEKYHAIECPVFGTLIACQVQYTVLTSIRMTIIAIQNATSLDALKQDLLNVDLNKDPRTKGWDDTGKFCSDQYRSAYSLSNDINECSLKDSITRSLWVALSVCILSKKSNIFEKDLAPDTLAKDPDVIFVGGLILKNIHICGINMHKYGSTANSSAHGKVLIPVTSLLNHSCDSNILRLLQANHMVCCAAYPIEEGEQIFDNYGARYSVMPLKQRQAVCKLRHFECECLPCIQNWPLFEDIPSYRNQRLPYQTKIQLDLAWAQLQRQCQIFMRNGSTWNTTNMVQLLESIETLYNLAEKPCLELNVAREMLKDMYESVESEFNHVPINPAVKIRDSALFYFSLMSHFIRY